MLEELLKYFGNVLNLRVMYPIKMADQEFTDKRSLVSKLRHFPRVNNEYASCTFLEDLCPSIPTLVKRKVVGNLNFTNPGVVAFADVVKRLKGSAKVSDYDPEISTAAGRGNRLLSHTKLVEALGGEYKIKTAEECLDTIFN